MANILAGKEIVKEFIQQDATPTALASESMLLLDDAAHRAAMRANFARVRQKLIASGAISPAQAVLGALT
jgi:lipid-A-disaccharide synthase